MQCALHSEMGDKIEQGRKRKMAAEVQGEVPPPVAMMGLITGYWLSQAVGVVAKLGVADYLGNGPSTCDELARSVGAESAIPRAAVAIQRWCLHPSHAAFIRIDCARRDPARGCSRFGAQLCNY
jgi:hypothetical protein